MIPARLRALLGGDAFVGTGAMGQPIVAPRDEAAVAMLIDTAGAYGWRVGIVGAGSWSPPDCPADVLLSTRRLDTIVQVSPSDLVVVTQAGVRGRTLRTALADAGAWAAVDHPGRDRTVGSAIATATAGPLRSGFGPVRDHVLGVTVVTGEGRIVRPGGTVMKNVAGYDLTKLVVGSFGAFGVVTSVTLRLRAVPRADVTLIGSGRRDELLDSAQAMTDAGLTPSGLELLSPVAASQQRWHLAIRLTGREAEVAAARDGVRRCASVDLVELPPREAAGAWDRLLETACGHALTLRIGSLPTGLERCLDQLEHDLGESWTSVSAPAGIVRWSGNASADSLRRFRQWAAEQEMPVTLERAPWPILAAVGHFGAYREGAGRLAEALRRTFDPRDVLLTAAGTSR
jgi:glycolate oxidase FAD binding subunit